MYIAAIITERILTLPLPPCSHSCVSSIHFQIFLQQRSSRHPQSPHSSANKRMPTFLPHGLTSPGIYLHGERTGSVVRRDGTVPKPSLLERYFHRPVGSSFDSIDIVTYHSTFGASKSPPQYAAESWMEKQWEDDSNRFLVFRKRATTRVSVSISHLAYRRKLSLLEQNNSTGIQHESPTKFMSTNNHSCCNSHHHRLPRYSSWVPHPSTKENCSTCGCF